MTGPRSVLSEVELVLAALFGEFVFSFAFVFEFASDAGIGLQALIDSSSAASTSAPVDVFRELRVLNIVDLYCSLYGTISIRESAGVSETKHSTRMSWEEKLVRHGQKVDPSNGVRNHLREQVDQPPNPRRLVLRGYMNPRPTPLEWPIRLLTQTVLTS
jgi:hypothetical protein